jgi:hypothetical protein
MIYLLHKSKEQMKIFDEEIRYPEKGDKFFISDGQSEEIAWLNKSFQEFSSYANCYQTGALTLIDSSLIDDKLRDFNIYPVIFLIRHYLELRLKELIQGLNYCKAQNKDFPTHHDLSNLWSEFKVSYKKIGELTDDKFLVIDELIKEMTSVDPISMSFRYPVDKNGNKTQRLEYINLTNLRETFVRVCFVFDGVAMQIAHYVDITEDMMGEVYENYW